MRKSLFFKLSVGSLFSGILISIALIHGVTHSRRPKFEPRMRENAQLYIRYVVTQLGDAPTFEKGKEFAEKMGLAIRIEGEGWAWASSDDIPTIASMPQWPPRRPSEQGPRGPRPGPPGFFRVLSGPPPGGPVEIIDYQFPQGPAKVMVAVPKMVFESSMEDVYPVIAFVLIVLGLSYLFIRKMLSPVRSLALGVSTIGQGNLDHRVPVESQDELGRLAVGFNDMVVRVKDMVQSKKTLLIDVSHELRSPLTRAKVGLELIDNHEAVPQIRRDLDELEGMIETLLEEARLEGGKQLLEKFRADATGIVRKLVDEYRSRNKPVSLEASETVFASLDSDRFKSVVRNLVDNALKYSSEGKPVVVSLKKTAGGLELAVRDQGIGISAEEIPKVFEPFYRVDRSRARKTGGFGLGLSLCRKIVEAHGGNISLTSQPGVGTVVTVNVPEA